MQQLIAQLAPALLTFAVGLVVGYGRAASRISVLEANVHALTDQVNRLENVLLFGNPEGGRRRGDVPISR